ncbi:MAG: flagellar hook protein FlgE [Gammaproteobacteria bacterium]|jgi:flagellar hook protein FlgE|nr:flagellar hook protein FlgE [Gammaproteobacteria bacterium]
MSFQIALTGLNAASADLAVTSNNIANANTTGFKKSRTEFADVFAGDATGIGAGVRLTDVRQEYTQGNVNITERQLDLAISGDGFFVTSDGGSLLYSRVGAFGLNNDGFVENSQGERLQVYAPTSDGGFNTGQLQDLELTVDVNPPEASTIVDMAVNLSASAVAPTAAPFDPTNPDTFTNSTATVVYDSLGVARTANYYFIKGATDWEVAQTIDGNVIGTPQPIAFGAGGTLTAPASGIVSFGPYAPPNGAASLDVSLDLTSTTQFGETFVVNSINPDGRAAGRLRNVEIDDTGVVFARYTNGQSTSIGKIALATFANPEGLSKASDISFQETFGSGVALRGEAGTSNFGVISSGALESSNVDLTAELVNLITAQRLFQANAQVISTFDAVTQTIINIR